MRVSKALARVLLGVAMVEAANDNQGNSNSKAVQQQQQQQ